MPRLTENDAPYRMEFSTFVRRQALKKSNGICQCGCGRPFTDHPKERPHYDHIHPAAIGGRATQENCRVVRVECHKAKTREIDMPMIVKARRQEAKRTNTWGTRKRRIPGSKGTGLRKGVDGSVSRVVEVRDDDE